MSKKLIASLLAIVMVLSAFPLSAFAYGLPESDHPYANDAYEEWSYTGKQTTKSISVTFSEYTDVEEDYDYIMIFDSAGKRLGIFTGTALAGKTVSYNVNSLTIVLETDGSGTLYGFKVTDITENDFTVEEASVTASSNISVKEDRKTGTLTFSGSGTLYFDVCGNVDWVKTIVVEEGITEIDKSFYDFENAESFELADGITSLYSDYFTDCKSFYDNPDNWDGNALYIGNYLITSKPCKFLTVKDGTKCIIINSVNAAAVYIPDSVEHIGYISLDTDIYCGEGSYAQTWCSENSDSENYYNVFTPGSLKFEYSAPVISLGTPLSSAVKLYSLSADFEWGRVTGGFSSSGYSTRRSGNQKVTVTCGGKSITFDIAVSSDSEQYINFNDPQLKNEFSDYNEDGLISVDEAEAYDGYISLYGIKDLSGLEYAVNARFYDARYSGCDIEQIFDKLQIYEDVQIPVSLSKHMSEFGRIEDLFDYDDEDYYQYWLPSDFEYKTSDSSVAYVKDDILCLQKPGKAVITVTLGSASKTFSVTVVDTDIPVEGISENIPELVSYRMMNYNNSVYYYDGAYEIVADKQKAVYSTNVGNIAYHAFYYLTDNDKLWTCAEGYESGRIESMDLGDDFKKIDPVCNIGLDKNGDCYDIETMELILSDVKDVRCGYMLTKSGQLFFYKRYQDTKLVDSNVNKILDSDTGGYYYAYYRIYYLLNNGTVKEAYNGEYTDESELNNRQIKDLGVYHGVYYYTDSDNNLWAQRKWSSESEKITSSVKYLVKHGDYGDFRYPMGFVTQNDDLYLVAAVEDNGNALPDKPFAENVKKVGSTCYLTNNNELYVAYEGNINYSYYSIGNPDSENNMFRLMTGVVDFADNYDSANLYDYYEDYYCASEILFTRVDGSLWSYDTYSHELNQIIEGEPSEPVHTHTFKHITVPSTCKVQGMEYDICTECGETANSKVLPLAAHTWGEWATVTEPTTESTGLMKRGCSVCGKEVTKPIPKLNVLKDNNTGVEIIYGDQFDSGVKINVTEEFDGNSFQLINSEYENVNSAVFDITVSKNGSSVQPNGKVTVRIPLPESFKGDKTFVCYIDSVNNKVTKIPAVVKDGYVVFEVDHFSRYAVVESAGGIKSVKVDDITLYYKKKAQIKPVIEADDGVEYSVKEYSVKSVKYESSDPKVVTVDDDGNITTRRKGTAEIKVTVTDQNGKSVTDTCKVTVKYTIIQLIISLILGPFGWPWN